MSTILITGSSGYLGTELCRLLNANPEVTSIIGIDLAEPRENFSKLTFHKRDCTGTIGDIFDEHQVDTVVHLVYVLNMIHDSAKMTRINVGTMENVLEQCSLHSVSRIMVTSSTTAYGAHASNPIPLMEEDKLRGNRDYQYAYEKTIVEARLNAYQSTHPDCDVVIARPAIVLGPNVDNFLGRYITRGVVPWVQGRQALQFLHEADAAGALYALTLEADRGIYNVGPAESADPVAVARENGGHVLQIPSWILRPLNQLAWVLRLRFLAEAPGSMINFITHPWIADGSKLESATSFKYAHTSTDALQSVFDRNKEQTA